MADLKIIISTVTKGLSNAQKVANELGSIREQALALSAPFLAVGAAAVAAFNEIATVTAKYQSTLGASAEESKRYAEVARAVWANNFAGDITEAAEVVKEALQTMGDTGEKELQRISEKAIGIKDAFGTETAESISAAKTLMDSFGLSSDQAFDFLTKGYQRGLDRSGDFLDSINEYGTQFQSAGADAGQFFSIMESGLQGGALGTDKAADAFKEFRLRILSGAADVDEALKTIKIDPTQFVGDLAAGNTTVTSAFQVVVDGLNGIEDKAAQARIGTALLGTQFEDLGDAALSINTAKTTTEELAGATESLGAQYATIQSIGEGLWRGILDGAISVLDFVNRLVQSFQGMDKTAQALALTLGGYTAVFAAWKLGGSIVIGAITNIIISLKATVISARAASIALLETSGVMTAFAAVGFVAALAFAVVEVYKLTEAIIGWRDAAREADQNWKNLAADAQAVMNSYSDFANIPKIPADLTKASQEELVKYRDELQNTRVYYSALLSDLDAKRQETNAFGILTKDAKKAQKEFDIAKEKFAGLKSELERISAAGLEKPTVAIKASAEAMDEFEKAAKKGYAEAVKAAEDAAGRIIALEDEKRLAQLNGEDLLRELRRGGMTEAEQQADIERQAAEKASAAKRAALQGDYDLAQKLNKDSIGLYQQVAKSDLSAAESGIKQRLAFEQELLNERIANEEKAKAAAAETAAAIKTDLDTITAAKEAKIQIELTNFQEMEGRLAELTKDETKTITVKTVEAKASGGPVGFARGGSLPGYGGGDRISAILEAGEFIIRKEAVKKYGAGLFAALNAMRAPFNAAKMSIPMPRIPRVAYATGGAVSGGPVSTFELKLPTGNTVGPMMSGREVVQTLERELGKMSKLRPNK